jgi:uncharacterized protein YyaL (SSP411 family)
MVVIGPRNSTRTHELIRAIWGKAMPNRFLVTIEPGEALPASHPAHGKEMQNGQPTVYICQRNACTAPITNAVALSQTLQLPQQQQAAAGNA